MSQAQAPWDTPRQGRMVMLDEDNAHVLSYARVAEDGSTILASMNMSATTQTITLELAAAGGLDGAHCVTLLSSPHLIANVKVGAAVAVVRAGASAC